MVEVVLCISDYVALKRRLSAVRAERVERKCLPHLRLHAPVEYKVGGQFALGSFAIYNIIYSGRVFGSCVAYDATLRVGVLLAEHLEKRLAALLLLLCRVGRSSDFVDAL